MALPIHPILGILGDNLRLRGSVLPLTRAASTRWAKGLNLPRGGATVLYTGHMYQLIPAIDAMAGQMARLENSPVTKLFGLGRMVNKIINLSFFMSLLASRELKQRNDEALQNIARLLQAAGLEFGYLYGDEMYSGALVYDEGLDDIFARHAKRVAERFKKHGVRKVITVDPHTTNMLREIYPKFVEGFDVEVVSYLDVLAEEAPEVVRSSNASVAMHDSCVYARYEGIVDQPRTLMARAGVTVGEPELSGLATHCCGGPIESLFPGEAHRIAKARIEQLREAGDSIVTSCPICWVNLRKAAGEMVPVQDISDLLSKAYVAASD